MVEQKVARPSEEAIFFIRYQPCSKYPISLLYFPTGNERVQIQTKVSRALRHLFPASATAGGVVAAAGSGRGKLP